LSYRYERRRNERRRNNGCLKALVALVWIILLGVLAYRLWLRPQVSQYVGRQIADQIGGGNGGPAGQEGLPTAIAALPAGELRVTEAQANDYLSARAGSLKPIDSVTLHFVPGEVQADLQAYGTTSTARAGLEVRNGRVVTADPQLNGPLSQVITLSDLTQPLERQLNDQLAAQGRRVTEVRIEQGVLVLIIE
jgi:hypothetical protein